MVTACGRLASENQSTPTVSIDFSKRLATPAEPRVSPRERSLNIAIAGMTSPLETLRYYLYPAHSASWNVGQEADWRPSEAILVS